MPLAAILPAAKAALAKGGAALGKAKASGAGQAKGLLGKAKDKAGGMDKVAAAEGALEGVRNMAKTAEEAAAQLQAPAPEQRKAQAVRSKGAQALASHLLGR